MEPRKTTEGKAAPSPPGVTERNAASPRTSKRVTVEFGEPATRALEMLAAELHTTQAEVLRDSLSLYAFIVQLLRTEAGDLAHVHHGAIKKVIAVPGLAPDYYDDEVAAEPQPRGSLAQQYNRLHRAKASKEP